MLKPWQTVLIVIIVVSFCMYLFFSKHWTGLFPILL